jgi:hypothetical protein
MHILSFGVLLESGSHYVSQASLKLTVYPSVETLQLYVTTPRVQFHIIN